jgi:Icc-related predicted phosphoesterase
VENLPNPKRKQRINLLTGTLQSVRKKIDSYHILILELSLIGGAAFFCLLFTVKFVAISDTHCRHRNLRLPTGDVLIHAGDVSYRGEKSEVMDFLDWFKEQNYKYKIFIAGNHDFFFERENRTAIKNIIPPGIIYLNDSGTSIEGVNIWGSPVTPWFFNWAFNKRRGAPIAKHWKLIPADTNILISHGPAFGILDVLVNEQHAGCKDLLERVLDIKPSVVVSGHIHESYGTTKRHGIKFINASVLNESYELVNRPIEFRI